MQQALNEAIGKLVLDETQRLNQQFISEAIRQWDAGQVTGISFRLWILFEVAKQWLLMTERN